MNEKNIIGETENMNNGRNFGLYEGSDYYTDDIQVKLDSEAKNYATQINRINVNDTFFGFQKKDKQMKKKIEKIDEIFEKYKQRISLTQEHIAKYEQLKSENKMGLETVVNSQKDKSQTGVESKLIELEKKQYNQRMEGLNTNITYAKLAITIFFAYLDQLTTFKENLIHGDKSNIELTYEKKRLKDLFDK